MVGQRRLMKELTDLQRDPTAALRNIKADDIFRWSGFIYPEYPPYNKAAFKVNIHFPIDYPFKPFHIGFVTKIYNPMVTEDGRICRCFWCNDWSPTWTVDFVVKEHLLKVLYNPIHDHVANERRGHTIFREYTHDYDMFLQKAEEFTVLHGELREDSNVLCQGGTYYMPVPPKVVIIYTTKNREGAEDELRSLNEMLPEINVTPVIVKDPTKAEIVEAIQHTNCQESTSGLIVIIMSHGQKGSIEASDGAVNLNEMLLHMNIQSLDGKPKVLIVQACQAKPAATEDERSSQVDGVPEIDARRANSQIASNFDVKHPDFMVLIASVNGGVAYRNTLIPIFSENLRKSSQNEDLYSVFLKTNEKIRGALPEQVAEFRSTFKLKLCLKNVFKPGKVQASPVTAPITVPS